MSALIEIEEKLFIAPEALYLVKDEGKEFVEHSLNRWDDSENDNWNDSEDNDDEVLDSDYNGIAIEDMYSYTQDSDVSDQLVIEMFEAGLLAIREDNYDNNYDISSVALFDLTHQIDNDTYYLDIDYFYKEILVELSANEGIIPKFIYVDSPYSNDVIIALPLFNIRVVWK